MDDNGVSYQFMERIRDLCSSNNVTLVVAPAGYGSDALRPSFNRHRRLWMSEVTNVLGFVKAMVALGYIVEGRSRYPAMRAYSAHLWAYQNFGGHNSAQFLALLRDSLTVCLDEALERRTERDREMIKSRDAVAFEFEKHLQESTRGVGACAEYPHELMVQTFGDFASRMRTTTDPVRR